MRPSTSAVRYAGAAVTVAPPRGVQHRTFLGLFGRKKKSDGAKDSPFRPQSKQILAQDNLFHPLSQSPFPVLRARAERIKKLAPCPVHLRKGQRVLVNFECPDCGWPTHYSEKEWREDTEHGKYVGRLREANEDEHDLRSGREMTEFRLPGAQGYEENINMSSWDVFFYTRNFPSIESERSRRHVSKLLTFPSSIAAVLHQNSPYTTRNRRMTREGLRSFLALRQLLHPVLGAKQSLETVRIFVVGARAESTLPTPVWDQLRYIFPNVNLHLFLIGPEVSLPNSSGVARHSDPQGVNEDSVRTGEPSRKAKTRPSSYGPDAPSKTIVVSEAVTMTYIQASYETVHHQMEPFDPYTDVFFAFSPGFGFPSQNAYPRPKLEGDDAEQGVEGAEAAATEPAQPVTLSNSTEANIDPLAANVESQGEATSSQNIGGVDSMPDASSTVRYDPTGEGLKTQSQPPALDATAASAEAGTADAQLPPGGKPSSTLPTLPPLLQAQSEWATALTQMLSTKCPIVATGFSPADVRRDVEAFESVEGIRGEFEWLITPGENVFGSLSWSIADFDPRVAVKANWGIWAVRGKRYDLEGPAAFVNLNPFSTKGLEGADE